LPRCRHRRRTPAPPSRDSPPWQCLPPAAPKPKRAHRQARAHTVPRSRSRPPVPARRVAPAAAHGADRSRTPYISPARGAQNSLRSCAVSESAGGLTLLRPFSHLRANRPKSRAIIETACASVHSEAKLLDVGEYSVELVKTVVADDELALALRPLLDGDRGAELLGQFLLQALDIGVT